jgi:hypothetical protein
MSEPVRFADELPPLPKHTGCIAVDSTDIYTVTPVYTESQMREYTAQAVAERAAEIGRLRGENKALQDGIVRDFVDVGVKNAITELRAEVEALKADAERYRWLRDRNDWYAEPRLDEVDGTKWELIFYSPQRIEDPTDDVNLDAAVDRARGQE